MKLIEFDGVKYIPFEWQKPEDTDYAIGEICFGIYAAIYGDGPYLIVANGDKTFRPFGFRFKTDKDVQPLLVLTMPGIGRKGLIESEESFRARTSEK